MFPARPPRSRDASDAREPWASDDAQSKPQRRWRAQRFRYVAWRGKLVMREPSSCKGKGQRLGQGKAAKPAKVRREVC